MLIDSNLVFLDSAEAKTADSLPKALDSHLSQSNDSGTIFYENSLP